MKYIKVEMDDSNPKNARRTIIRYVSCAPDPLEPTGEILAGAAVRTARLTGDQLYGGNIASLSNLRAEMISPEVLDVYVVPGLAKRGENPPTVRQECEANRISLEF